MDSDDEVFQIPPPEDSSPAHHRKLKRLRRASRAPNDEPVALAPSVDPAAQISTDPEPPKEAGGVPADRERPLSPISRFSPLPRSEESGKELDEDEGEQLEQLDPLFGDQARFTGRETGDLGRGMEQEELALFGGNGDQGDWSGEMADWGSKTKKSAKKRLSMDEGGEDNPDKENKRKKNKKDGADRKPPGESVRSNRKLEKERKVYLEQLHAESQRLLRETRDASFKPVPLVQKPISSVLEKIRLRKLEVLKKSGNIYDSETLSDAPVRSSSSVHRFDIACGSAEGDVSINIPERSEGNTHSVIQPDGPPENNTPLLTTTSLKPESDPLDDSSSEEEQYYDKENSDPLKDQPPPVDLYKKFDLAKPFVDDEAEEEDDSDHDNMRFPENEEDDENEESEEMPNDLIATGYEEMPVDQEKRNQLHQQWLEQQDEAETDNVLLRLKSHQDKREPTFFHDEEYAEEAGDEPEEDSLDEAIPTNTVRQNSKKAKQMMAQMFNDKDDGFVSSDDEETEQRLSRQLILEQTEKKCPIISPEEDGNSREVFGLIKKLNIAPDPKKRIKPASSTFDQLFLGGNSNSSSKSSFLGRASSNSLPSSRKQNSVTVKSFVFSRDDSNSRSAVSTSESLADLNQKETLPPTKTAKFSGSQPKSDGSKTKPGSSNASGPSLFQILRRSTVMLDQQLNTAGHKNGNIISETQAAYQLSAFKLRNRFSKRSTQET